MARYCYITGRAGRTTYRDAWVCEEHAQAFANKHGLQILDAQPRRE